MSAREETRQLRRNVYLFLTQTVLPGIRYGERVLEIGPAHAGSCPLQEYYVDVKAAVLSAGGVYTSVDPDPAACANKVADFTAIDWKSSEFDVVIACEVFEHVQSIWRVPAICRTMLRRGGRLYFSMPFAFFIHEPSPDYWRLTDQAIGMLFREYFALEVTGLHFGDHAMPLHYTVEATAV